jgi:hypothetical protein
MPKYRVCLQETVEYELFIDAANEAEAAKKGDSTLATLGPIKLAQAVTAVVDREVTDCKEWSA